MSADNYPTEQERADTRVQRAFNPLEDGATQQASLTTTPAEVTLEAGELYKFWGSVKFHLVFGDSVTAAVATAHPHREQEDHFYYTVTHTRCSVVKYADEDDGTLWVTKQAIK